MQFFMQDPHLNETYFRVNQPAVYWPYICVRHLRMYYTPALVLVGTLGNTGTCLTLTRGPLQKSSAAPYILGLAFIDIVFLLCIFTIWMGLFHIDVFALAGGCQAVILLTSVCTFLAVWLVVAMMIERTLLMRTLNRSTACCSNLKGRITVGCLCALAIVLYLNLSLLYGVLETPAGLACLPLPHVLVVTDVLAKVDALLNFSLAYVIVSILLVVTVYSHIREGRHRHQHGRDNMINTSFNGERTMTQLIICAAFTFLLCNLPGHILHITAMLRSPDNMMDNTIHVFLWQQILLFLFFTRCAVTPWAYVIFSRPHAAATFEVLKNTFKCNSTTPPTNGCSIEMTQLQT